MAHGFLLLLLPLPLPLLLFSAAANLVLQPTCPT
jgi:hypothetical protein